MLGYFCRLETLLPFGSIVLLSRYGLFGAHSPLLWPICINFRLAQPCCWVTVKHLPATLGIFFSEARFRSSSGLSCNSRTELVALLYWFCRCVVVWIRMYYCISPHVVKLTKHCSTFPNPHLWTDVMKLKWWAELPRCQFRSIGKSQIPRTLHYARTLFATHGCPTLGPGWSAHKEAAGRCGSTGRVQNGFGARCLSCNMYWQLIFTCSNRQWFTFKRFAAQS